MVMLRNLYIVLTIISFAAVLNCSIDKSTNDGVPDAPSELTGTALSSNTIELQWVDNSDNEIGFSVYRKIYDDYISIGSVEVNDFIFTDDSLPSCSFANYYIVAYNGNGESSRSNRVNIPLICSDRP